MRNLPEITTAYRVDSDLSAFANLLFMRVLLTLTSTIELRARHWLDLVFFIRIDFKFTLGKQRLNPLA